MKRNYFIFAVVGLLIGFAIGYGLLPKGPSGILPERERVEFYQEVGSAAVWGDMEGFGNTLVSMIPTTFPQTFKMSTITTHEDGRESITRHTHRFRAQLARETTILFFISATEPIDFKILLVGREAGGDFVYRTILHAPNITSHHDLFRVRESGVYKFVFERTQVKPVATVTFTVLDVSSSPLPAIVSSGQRSSDM